MTVRSRILALAAAAALLMVHAACEPEIGDECENTIDCPAGSVCDLASPGGYCLGRNCSSNDDCPAEAVCVDFDEYTHYCMRSCSADSDCRTGYVCREDVGVDPFCYVEPPPGEPPFTRAGE